MSKTSIKKKKWVLPVLLLLLIALLGVTYFALTLYNKQQAEKEQGSVQTLEPIISLSADEIRKIHYTNPQGELTFEKDETGEWRLPEDPSMPLSASSVSALASAFANLTPSQIVADTQSDAASYGLSDPQLSITLVTDNSQTITLKVGSKNTYSGGYYAALEGDDHVYMISSTPVKRLEMTKYDYCSAASPAFASESAVYAARYDGGELTYALQKYNEVRRDLTWCDFFYWFTTESDESVSPTDADTCSYFLEALSGLQGSKVIDYTDDEAKLAEYGLDEKSSIRLDMESDDGTTSLSCSFWIGSQADESNYYFRCSDNDGVYLIDKESVDDVLSYQVRDFYTKGFSIITIDNVNSIDVTAEGVTYKLTMERHEEPVEAEEETTAEDGSEAATTQTVTTYFVNGEEWSDTDFRNLYTSLIMILADRAMTEEETPVDADPTISITFHTSLEYFPEVEVAYTYFDNNFYQATVNGETKMLVNKNDINQLLETLSSIK